MNLSRLLVLGVLESNGPLHGHKVRREAETKNVERWGGVNVGSLYRELHRMESEELIEAVRSEQLGRRPARTVYAITDEGRRELSRLRTEAFRSEEGSLDPVGVALLFGGPIDAAELASQLGFRRQLLRAHLRALEEERHRFTPGLTMAAIAVYRRGELRLAAELAWHDELESILIAESGDLWAEKPAGAAPGGGGPEPAPDRAPGGPATHHEEDM